MNIDGNGRHFLVKADKSRPAAARQHPDRALAHPVFADELFDDLRNRASAQAGATREICAGNGLTGPDQLENYVAVDDPRGLARCKLHLGEVNVPNAMPVVLQFRATSDLKSA